MNEVDLLIVGGGINGVGIARDAAGRGLSVLLVEKDDLAAHTSSASSKLVHGGLRYLEQFDFRLVRESLRERGRLLRSAPHIVEPLEFVLPLAPSSRPGWMIRAGLFVYDRLGGRKVLPASRAVRLDRDSLGAGLRPGMSRGFSYWDCRVQDSRLVILNAIDAEERGATILARTEFVEARREGRRWLATLRDSGGERTVIARALVNAAGPWAAQLLGRIPGSKQRGRIRLVKGSHIVVPRLYPGEHAFLLQNADRRVVFAIPFERRFTLVGTTDLDWTGAPDEPRISGAEMDYLLATVGRYFAAKVAATDVVWSYAGIRALCEDGASDPWKVTRDYFLDLDSANGPPLLSVFGGKLTAYRRLAERTLDRLAPAFPTLGGAWTERALLPGGDISTGGMEGLIRALADAWPALPGELLARLARTYGTRTERLLEGVRSVGDLGEHFGAGLHAREIDYLVANEWARTADDVLWRRTKLGLHLSEDEAGLVADFLESVR